MALQGKLSLLLLGCIIAIHISSNEAANIRLTHNGLYVARFYVYWDEKGESKSWYKNDQDLTAGFSEELHIPDDATNLAVKAKEATGLIWERWRVVFDKGNVPVVPNREFKIWGTTLNPDYSVNPSV